MNSIYREPVLGIDLGASYTKIAYRPGWARGDRFKEPCRLVMIDDTPLVPSLVIRRDDKRKPWLFGKDAADYRAKSGDRVFANWKADFFTKDLTIQAGGSLKAAGEFFGWLRLKILDAGIDVSACRVKICLPAFPDIERPASLLGQEMELAGWKNVSVTRVTEPRANVVGVFAEGRNTLNRHLGSKEIYPHFMDMYPRSSPLMAHLRKHALSGGTRHAAIGVIDVGSFTTDLSIVRLDAGADGDCIDSVKQESYRIGIIGGFEQPLLKELSSRHGFSVDRLTFNGRENIKRAFSGGDPINLVHPDGRIVELGEAKDQKLANDLAESFASQVRDAYRQTAKGEGVKDLLLTGGGSEAPLIRDAIHAQFRSAGVRWANVDGLEEESRSRAACRRWPDSGEALVRLATALGSASVILDLPTGVPGEERPTIRNVESPWISCTCMGGNKECMRCGGMGMYRRAS